MVLALSKTNNYVVETPVILVAQPQKRAPTTEPMLGRHLGLTKASKPPALLFHAGYRKLKDTQHGCTRGLLTFHKERQVFGTMRSQVKTNLRVVQTAAEREEKHGAAGAKFVDSIA